MKTYQYTLPFLFILLIGISCTSSEEKTSIPKKGNPVPVTVLKLNKSDLSSPISASGNFTTNDETVLSFKTGGIISKTYVQEGDPVRKGQLLASLDLTEVQAGLNQAKLALDKAKRDHDRANRLYTDSVATLEQFQNSETALQIAQEQYNSVEFNLEYSQIRANQNGYVLRKFANNGQQVGPGTPVFQINGAQDSPWIFKANVNDVNWALIQEGDSSQVFLETSSEQTFIGEVVRKSRAADPYSGSWWVEIQIQNPPKNVLASGLFARSEIYPSKQSEGWEIPYASLFDAQGDQGYVFVVGKNDQASRVPVQLGRISNQTVQVLSGLENFDQLIVSGSAYLSDNSPIQIQ